MALSIESESATVPAPLADRLPMNARLCLLALGFAISASAADAPALPQKLSPQDAHLHFSGRWDVSTPTSPRCEWTASSISLQGNFSALNVHLEGDKPGNAFEVIVDGASAGTITMVPEQKVYPVVSGLSAGPHALTLFKRTESWPGAVKFLGFEAPAEATFTAPGVPTRRIEFLGDSITCGYGNEGKSKEEHFSLATENAWLAWGAITARTLRAELAVEAISGIWLQDNGKKKALPALFDHTLPFSASPTWDFSRWQPEVVVVNLGTNDSGKPIDPPRWNEAYRGFIAQIRKAYPQAHIFLTIGSMGHGPKGIIAKLNGELVTALAGEGETKVHAVALANQDERNGIGSDWHPSAKTQQLMADQISAEIRTVMHW